MQTPEQEMGRTHALEGLLAELKSLTLELGAEDQATGEALLKAHSELEGALRVWNQYRRGC